MPRKVFQSSVDKQWSVGVFDPKTGDLLRSGSLRWFKTKKGAERYKARTDR